MLVRASPSATETRDRWQSLACSASLVLVIDLDEALVEPGSPGQERALDLEAILVLNHLGNIGVRVAIIASRPGDADGEMRELIPGAWWVSDEPCAIVRSARARVPGARVIAIGSRLTHADLGSSDASVAVGTGDVAADAVAADVKAVHRLLRWIAEVRRGRALPMPIRH